MLPAKRQQAEQAVTLKSHGFIPQQNRVRVILEGDTGMLPRHVHSAVDLVTSPRETQKGFLVQALRKTKEAAPHIERARRLLAHLTEAKDIDEAIGVAAIQDELVAAAGFSDKATKYFSRAELQAALAKVMAQIKANAGPEWREEITYRFLLTRLPVAHAAFLQRKSRRGGVGAGLPRRCF